MVDSKSSLIDESKVHFEALYPSNSRFEVIEEIFKYVKAGNSCQMIGLPGAGRSNVFGLLSFNREIRKAHVGENHKWFHFVNTNFSEVKYRSISDVTKFLFLALIESLRERKMDEEHETLRKIFKDSLFYDDELVLFQGLKEAIDYLAIEKELTIVFLFDRFEEYVPMLTNDFFANLRILRNRAKFRFSVVFSLNRPLEQLIEPAAFGQFFEFLADNQVFLPMFDRPGVEFRLKYLEKSTGKSINKKLVDEIFKLTGGHVKLVKIGFQVAMESNKLDDFKQKFLEQKATEGALFEIYTSLTPEEQTDLEKPTIQNEYLDKIGLVSEGKITIPLFEHYIKQKQPEKEKIWLDDNTREIKIGNVSVSENLTSSEGKLLTFFIQNEGKIMDREEVIEAVWGKNQFGVSDQAIDQLISRLRRKIEKNPNSPDHILTLKGKGFRFFA